MTGIMLLSGKISLSRLLQIRPAAVGLLNSGGLPIWEFLDTPVERFCRQFGLDMESWLKQVENLPVLPPDSDWSVEPLYRVADYLTDEHHVFRKSLLDLSRLLHPHRHPVSPGNSWLEQVDGLFKPFKEGFLIHMREEEERFFPHILRLEALICDPGSRPLPGLLPLGKFPVEHIAPAEEHLKQAMNAIQEKMLACRIQEPTTDLARQLPAGLENFEKRLLRHNDIEIRFLFPRAVEIEKRFAHSVTTSHPSSKE
jgi:iron-sulfur cluster repair protein YtfE (RIC family)